MKKHESTYNSSLKGYRIEARDTAPCHVAPVVLACGILTKDWRTIRVVKSSSGSGVPDFSFNQDCDLMPYESAVALAHTLIARNHLANIEVRLVQYEYRVQSTTTKIGIVKDVLIASDPLRFAKIEIEDVQPTNNTPTPEPVTTPNPS